MKNHMTRNMIHGLFAWALLLTMPALVWGEGPPRISLEATPLQKISLTVGKSVILGTSEPIKRISLGTPEGIPEIAVALVLTPRQIYLTGKNPGVTNLTLWGVNKKFTAIMDIEVSPDFSRLQEMLQKILPEEKKVTVTATHDNITLSGSVSSAVNLSQALAVAEPFFPKKVINLLKVDAWPDAAKLREAIQRAAPEEKNLEVLVSPENQVTLSGTAGSKASISRIQALAETYFPKRVLNLIEVENAPARLKETLHRVLPEEKNIRVYSTQEYITLSGTVSSASTLAQVLALAEPYAPGKIVNLMEVAGIHQVMLEVRVAEMSRSLLRRLGFNFNYISDSGANLGMSMLSNLTRLPAAGWPQNPLVVSDRINAMFRFTGQGATWTTFIDALKEEGLLKVLAEPTLITLSGKPANFLAGGEFPVPVPQPSGGGSTVTIEYKPFGVGLNFTPIVLSNKKIHVQVAPEVSDLDFSNAILISGYVVPSIATRRVSTTIELGDGQSFAIAGLLRDNVREVVSKFPVLGDIPILGALFRSSSFQKNETELIVIVTPRLVKPLDPAKQTLPTDPYIEPDDFEFYLMGQLEGKEKNKPAPSSSTPSSSAASRSTQEWGLEGKFGHIVEK